MVRPGPAIVLAAVAASCGYRNQVLSPYGSRIAVARTDDGAARGRARLHRGVDVGKMSLGEEVLATAPGRVTYVAFDRDVGTEVWIVHPSRHFTRYVHLATSTVKEGDHVDRGQVIGEVGLFRRSGGVIHVHLELYCGVAGDVCPQDGPLQHTLDPMTFMVGCFAASQAYADDRLVLTMPLRC